MTWNGLSPSKITGCLQQTLLYFTRTRFTKVSRYGVISGPYFPVFTLNTGKYGPEITPYFDTFHTVFTRVLVFSYIHFAFLPQHDAID